MNVVKDRTSGSPRRAHAAVIIRSRSGKSMRQPEGRFTRESITSYLPTGEALKEAATVLDQLGFTINLISRTYVSISGDPALFERVFHVKLVEKEYPVFSEQEDTSGPRQVRFVSDRPLTVPPSLSRLVEAVDLAPPVVWDVSGTPPAISYDHMEVPDDVARGMDAVKAHERGVTGLGIALAIIDSGFMSNANGALHPYYAGRNYAIAPVRSYGGDPNPGDDSDGHGTAVVACALAVAPGANCTIYKYKQARRYEDTHVVDVFTAAVNAGPDIISCSWEVPHQWLVDHNGVDGALQGEINVAVYMDGIVVLFAAGNHGIVAWPGSEPAVISVGGAFLGDDDSISASSVASSGSNVYNPGRLCPDVCGISGMNPRGIYIALPTQPDSAVDNALAQVKQNIVPPPPKKFPYLDETALDDGWIVASGTSTGTPMVAGVCALMMQQDPTLRRNPAGVLARLVNSCIGVTKGSNASTGAGLVQAYRAVHATDIWMKDNTDSDIGLVPTTARRPVYPPYTHWTSPDVKVVAGPLGNPQRDFDAAAEVDPSFNQDNYVYLRVRNRGTRDAANVNANLHYADPSTSLSFPNDWKDGSSGIASNGSITVGNVTSNSQRLPAIPANGFTVTPLPFVWRPPDPSTATQSQKLLDGRTVGHFCLLSRTSSDDDPILFPGGDESSIVQDNNLAMKNELVYSAAKGAPYLFKFFVRGPRKMKDLRESVLAADVAGLPERTEIEWNVTGRRTVHVVRHGEGTPSGERQRARGEQQLILVQLALEPAEEALCRITVRFPSATKPGRYPLHIAQTAGGQLVGGVTLVSRVT